MTAPSPRAAGKRRPRAGCADEPAPARPHRHWRSVFLTTLARTSNVSASAAAAGVDPARPCKLRRLDPAFADQWLAALCEGYDNLEMELLGYLRSPDPEKKMDVASGLRLLSLHRQTVTRQRPPEDGRSEQEVLDSIDAFIDRMRENTAANAGIMAEPEGDGESAE